MNAGAMGGATFDVVESVRVMDFDGNVRELLPQEMPVEYRGCATAERAHRAGRGAARAGRIRRKPSRSG